LSYSVCIQLHSAYSILFVLHLCSILPASSAPFHFTISVNTTLSKHNEENMCRPHHLFHHLINPKNRPTLSANLSATFVQRVLHRPSIMLDDSSHGTVDPEATALVGAVCIAFAAHLQKCASRMTLQQVSTSYMPLARTNCRLCLCQSGTSTKFAESLSG